VASLENHLRSKNQLQAQVEQELKRVKEVVKLDSTLRIFFKRIGISVSLKVIKVILIYLILAFLIKFFLYLELILDVWKGP
jgi:hypothetical protein